MFRRLSGFDSNTVTGSFAGKNVFRTHHQIHLNSVLEFSECHAPQDTAGTFDLRNAVAELSIFLICLQERIHCMTANDAAGNFAEKGFPFKNKGMPASN